MAQATEWRLDVHKDEAGWVTARLYEVAEDGIWSFIDAECFGPFDTALEVSMWFTRQWSPRARLPMR